MNIFILCFQTKHKLIEKTQKPKNDSPLKFPPGGPPKLPGSIFDDFAPISNCCRLPVSGSFLSIFFLFESRGYKFPFLFCGIAHISIFDIVMTPTVAISIFRLKWPFFCDLPSLHPNAIFLFFEIFTKCFKKLVKDDLSFRLEKNLVQTDHY